MKRETVRGICERRAFGPAIARDSVSASVCACLCLYIYVAICVCR